MSFQFPWVLKFLLPRERVDPEYIDEGQDTLTISIAVRSGTLEVGDIDSSQFTVRVIGEE